MSVEYFDPNNTANEFFINAGIRIQGSVSRETSRPKKGFKLYFRSEYGDSKLDYPMFGTDDLQTVFDHLVLRAGHNYSWANSGGTPVLRAEYLRDQFARNTQEALTGVSSRGDFVQLYINGQYWGLYNTAEDIDPDFAAAHFGGDADDYDIIKPNDSGGVEADDGTLDKWNTLFTTVDAAVTNDAVVDSTEYAAISAQLDTKALADYMINVFYRGDKDAPVLIGSSTSPRNFIAIVNRNDPNGKMIFQTQDGELGLDDVTYDRTEVAGNQNPARLYQKLRTNADFRQLMTDEIYRLFNNNGPLTVAANQARYTALMNKIDVAIVGESARWGNAQQDEAATRDTDWLAETDWIVNTYMPQRNTIMKIQFSNDFPGLNTLAPSLFVNGTASQGGTIASGSVITLTDSNSPAGTIYYTLDGSDPRASGGAPGATAVLYSSGFTLSQAGTVRSRVLKGGVWSPLTTVTLTVSPPSLRLSEMMFNPPAPGTGSPYARDEFEFLELVNTGSTTISLGGMQFNAGITATIASGVTLAPGARGVIIRNQAAFTYAYGTGYQILATYADKLADGGEQVRLIDPNSGTTIFDTTFVDSWYPTTDGSGFSLVVNDLGPSQATGSALGVATAWNASSTVGGSPGLATAVSAVAGRHVFYNNSSFDGLAPAMNASDDAAVATDKVALMPGVKATFANYTSYSKGLNGIMIDVAGMNQEQIWALKATDFTYRVSDASNTPVWSTAPAGATFAVRRGVGDGASDRISITWPDNLIAGKWLEVTVGANARTGLTTPDVFYFGNAPGESGNDPTNATVNGTDEIGARNNPRTFADPAPINFAYDYDRDGRVNATDEIIARNNGTTFITSLKLITAPTLVGGRGDPSAVPSGGGTPAGGLGGVRPGSASLPTPMKASFSSVLLSSLDADKVERGSILPGDANGGTIPVVR